VPPAALWLPRFVLFTWLHLTDSFAALLAPALLGSSPLFVLLFYWSFRRVPEDVFESARLDGAGPLALWRRVALPLAGRPWPPWRSWRSGCTGAISWARCCI
jgi:multiple sugar transport system permease protein